MLFHTLQSEGIAEELASIPFEFDLSDFDTDADGIQFDPPARFLIFAGDYCGGIYVSVGNGPTDENPVFHLSSEGFASRIGSTLKEALEHIVEMPNWRDLANRSLDTMLARFRSHSADLDASVPNWRNVQDRLRAVLELESHEGLVERLHYSIALGEKTRILVHGQVAPSAFWPS